jgi:hypothetical protein
MTSMIETSQESTQRARWANHYRNLMAHELVARTFSLQIATKRGHAEHGELRLQVLEAEQARRATWVMSATADPTAARLIGTRPF